MSDIDRQRLLSVAMPPGTTGRLAPGTVNITAVRYVPLKSQPKSSNESSNEAASD
jgi:hypothetical protein